MHHPYIACKSLLLLLFALAPGACGDNIGATSQDGGPGNARLVILMPPGDALGLKYGDRITLRARYENSAGEALAGEPVSFAMVAIGTGESTAGSILSAPAAATDALGVARVELTAGAQETSFRVSVDARDAPTQYFFVTISSGGFARLYITPVHEGWRAGEAFARVEIRLYKAAALTCAALDIDSPPDSLSPPRSLAGFGGTVDYQNVSAGQPHTVVAWAKVQVPMPMPMPTTDSPRPVAMGCVDLGPLQLPNSRVELALPVRDRPLVLDGVALTSTLDLAPVAAELDSRGASRQWNALGCEHGSGQLLLDCAIDAAAPDGALDCVPTQASPLTAEIAQHRGMPDPDGCRPDTDMSGQISLDQRLASAVGGSGAWPDRPALMNILLVRRDILGELVLGSELTALNDRAGRHRLATARVDTIMSSYELDLGLTSRPVIEQSPIPLAVDGNLLAVGAHGYTLRYGDIAARAFAAVALSPHGLDTRADSLGTALAEAVTGTGGLTGCAAMSAIVCAEVQQGSTCLASACTQGSEGLDPLLGAWWHLMSGPGLDVVLSGQGSAYDDDGDLIVEAAGGRAENGGIGAWDATMILADGTPVPVTGQW